MLRKYFCEISLILTIFLCDFEQFVNARYFVVNGWTPADHRTPVDIMVDVTNNIGLLVLECHNSNNHNNIAFSPYGLTSVLIALNEGVGGEAGLQIHRTARFPFDKDIMRVGFRDIHRLLRSYFVPQEGFLAGLSLSNDNLTLTPEYKSILQFYGYDLQQTKNGTQTDQKPGETETTPTPTTTIAVPEDPAPTTTVPETTTTTEAETTTSPAVAAEEPQTDQTTEPQTEPPTEPQTELIETTTTTVTDVSSPTSSSEPMIITETIETPTTIATDIPTETTVVTELTMVTETPVETTISVDTMTPEVVTEIMTPVVIEETMVPDVPVETTTSEVSTEIPAPETIAPDVPVETMTSEVSTETPTPETMAPDVPAETTTSEMSTEAVVTIVPEETMAPVAPTETITPDTTMETMAPEDPVDAMTPDVTTETMTTDVPPETMAPDVPPETMTPDVTTEIVVTEETMIPETLTESMTPDVVTETMTPDVITETLVADETMAPEQPVETLTTTTSEIIAEMITTNNPVTSESSAESLTVPNSPEVLDVDFDKTESASVERTKDPINEIERLDLNENPRRRRRRSLADYIIARYHDGRNYFTFQEPIVTSAPPVTTIPRAQYPFLVNGVKEQYRVNYTEYDAVLPFTYIPRVRALALRFPLDSDKYYLLIVLPINPQGVNNLICDIRKYDNLRNIVGSLKETYVRAIIPSFMLKGFVFLTNTLQRLGIRNVFEPGHADFTLMTEDENIYVTNIEQAVTVTIRNYMDTSTTLTNNNRKRLYYNYRPVEFKVTHPFIYFIMDSTLDVALMAGKVVNPLNSRIQ